MKKIKWIGLSIVAGLLVFLWFWNPHASRQAPFLMQKLDRTERGPAAPGSFQLWAPELDSCAEPAALRDAVSSLQPLGLLLEGLPVTDYLHLADALPPALSTALASRAYPLVHSQFSHTPALPGPQTLAAIPDLQKPLQRMSVAQSLALDLHLRILPIEHLRPSLWNELGVLAFGQVHLPARIDTVAWLLEFQKQLSPLVAEGLSGLYLDRNFWQKLPIHPLLLRKVLRQDLGFEGLLLSDYLNEDQTKAQLLADVDLWLTRKGEAERLAGQLTALRHEGALSAEWWIQKSRRLTQARKWMSSGERAPLSPPVQASLAGLSFQDAPRPQFASLEAYFGDRRWEYLRWKWQREAMVLAANPKQLLPLRNLSNHRYLLWTLSKDPVDKLAKRLDKYVSIQTQALPLDETLEHGLPDPGSERDILLIAVRDIPLQADRHRAFIGSLQRLAMQRPVVLLNFGRPENLNYFTDELAVVQSFEVTAQTLELAADLVFGGFSPSGRLPETYSAQFPKGHGLTFAGSRVHFSLPQDVGIAPEKLAGIDAIARTAIEDGLMPGCQVVVAKEGKIVYSKAFGRHTYESGAPPVQTDDLYDLASITKVAATTLMAMKLFEGKAFSINDRLRKMLDLDRKSSLRTISMKELLTHQTGLPSVMPLLPILKHRGPGNNACDLFFCSSRSAPYLVEVADSFYFDQRYHDTIWQQVQALPLGRSPVFRYSDVNFMLLQRVLEEQGGASLDRWAHENLYQPLGLRHLCFRPTEHFPASRIVPTEKDQRWRRQLVHGYVHDPVAALYGGVAGHAGLFGNAEDLAVLFQMLVNGGEYGGQRFLEPKTIDRFTTAQWGNHRGLGFDKPGHRTNASAHAEEASSETYGHTGFTGTCVWVDPTEKLVFVFLSNRIHPTRRNTGLIKKKIRRRIHQVVYDALYTFDPSMPSLLAPEETTDLFPIH